MTEQWSAAITFLAIAAAAAFGVILVTLVTAVKSRTTSPDRTATYECGEEPDGGAWIKFHPRYYLVALVFVLFDVEAVFLFPWALNIRTLGDTALWEMLLFVGVLLTGWAYAIRKGALQWP
ncbi:MAG: NADH-quinone oxidoreductase subunit A [Deltaproteobacteria bacterium]|nr:NADH-quinone oxidoreductase subunit A [Deltaproteobacteria bacterium]